MTLPGLFATQPDPGPQGLSAAAAQGKYTTALMWPPRSRELGEGVSVHWQLTQCWWEGRAALKGLGQLLQKSEVGWLVSQLLLPFQLGPESLLGPVSAAVPFPCSLQSGAALHTHTPGP